MITHADRSLARSNLSQVQGRELTHGRTNPFNINFLMCFVLPSVRDIEPDSCYCERANGLKQVCVCKHERALLLTLQCDLIDAARSAARLPCMHLFCLQFHKYLAKTTTGIKIEYIYK